MKITDRVRRASINWVLAMQSAYGQETGMKCFDVMRESFGEDLCGAVLFGIMEGVRSDQIIIRTTTDNLHRKIEAIKDILILRSDVRPIPDRTLTGSVIGLL